MKRAQVVSLGAVMIMALLASLSCARRPHGLIYQSGLTIWMLDPDRRVKKPLVEYARYAVGLSHDLKQVAYSTDSYDLWVADIDGTNARVVITNLLREAGLGIMQVSWSPRDRRIAILAVPDEDPQSNLEKLALYIVDLSTDTVRVVATGVIEFAWTRTGDQLVVNKQFCPEESPGIYLISADGLSSKLLFEGLLFEPYIAVSPVSNKVAFATDRPGRELEFSLFVVDPASGEVIDLLRDSELSFRSIAYPAWSPDGKRLAFIAMLRGEDGRAIFTLFVVDLQTHSLQELARGVRGPFVWSPTGHAIAIATTIMPSNGGIYQIDVKTGAIEKLTDDRLGEPKNFEWR